MNNIEHLLGKVHNCDCLEFMKQLPDKCVDLVLTDPPYNASNSNIGFKDGYKTINEEWDKGFSPIPFLDIAFSKIKDGGSIMAFCSYHLLGEYLQYGKKVQQIIHLEHITAMPALAKVYTPVVEYCIWFSTPRYIFNKQYSGRNILRNHKAGIVDGKFGHPSVKPTDLISQLLRVHANKDSVVFDPFMGSGTTAVACERLGRKWFGCELEPKYVAIANKRIEAERNQLKFF